MLLLMDNFTLHECAVRALKDQLPHTRVEFLPANSISVYQPCDQGIIQNFKTLYQRHWLQFMMHHSLNNTDLNKLMNIL